MVMAKERYVFKINTILLVCITNIYWT